MTDTDDNAGWFAGDESALRARIVDGEADEPRDWPGLGRGRVRIRRLA